MAVAADSFSAVGSRCARPSPFIDLIARLGGNALRMMRAGSIHSVPVSVAIHNRPSPPRTMD
ncbi:MAG: hypothetical protein ACRED3_14295, partial [Bradyrhizobium sp.]